MSWSGEDVVGDGHIIGFSVDGPTLRLECIRLCQNLTIGAAAFSGPSEQYPAASRCKILLSVAADITRF
jgi:hypothetical protein